MEEETIIAWIIVYCLQPTLQEFRQDSFTPGRFFHKLFLECVVFFILSLCGFVEKTTKAQRVLSDFCIFVVFFSSLPDHDGNIKDGRHSW